MVGYWSQDNKISSLTVSSLTKFCFPNADTFLSTATILFKRQNQKLWEVHVWKRVEYTLYSAPNHFKTKQMLQIWRTTDDASSRRRNRKPLCVLKMNIHATGSWKVSLYFSAPFHILGCAWMRKCVLTSSWSWPGVEAHHREIKNHIPPPLRKIEKLYESCSLLQQQSPRYSSLHLDIHREIRGFLSSHSFLLNCLHTYG